MAKSDGGAGRGDAIAFAYVGRMRIHLAPVRPDPERQGARVVNRRAEHGPMAMMHARRWLCRRICQDAVELQRALGNDMALYFEQACCVGRAPESMQLEQRTVRVEAGGDEDHHGERLGRAM